MTDNFERRWDHIRLASESADSFDRTFALALSVKFIEAGLTAVGVGREGQEGVKSRLAKWNESSKFTFGDALQRAFKARNEAVHGHRLPGEATAEHVTNLYDLWRALRRSFVTKANAAALAARILESNLVTDVFLFGSLARRKQRSRDPRDIDFLLFDHGEFSSLSGPYRRSRLSPELFLEGGFLDAPEHRAALACGWLDYVVVDGARFGVDAKYTLSLCRNQSDRLFFLNIADELVKYEPRERWVGRRPQVFERLGNLRRQLATENIVPRRR